MYRKRISHSPRPWRWVFLIIAGIIIFVPVYIYGQYQYFISTPVKPGSTESIVFTVKKGENSKSIGQRLADQKIILNADSFSFYSKFNNLDKNIKPGRFPISESLTVPEILASLSSNQNRQVVVTIPEGSTIKQIDQNLSDLDLIKPGEFISATKNFKLYQKYSFLKENAQKDLPFPLEGYMFPDTYFVSPTDFSAESFISQLLNTFKQKVSPDKLENQHSLQEIINVAAMVERETNKDADRGLVAGIIWKRLDQKWFLGIDATLLYLKNSREITTEDLANDHDYNTRINLGLPKGPIANPGISSIKAAISPEESEYFFYLTGKDGKNYYAITNDEHNANKNKYL